MHGPTHAWHVVLLGLTLAGGGAVAAAQSARPVEPSPEMKPLAFLVGKWTGEAKAPPAGQTPQTWVQTSEGTWALEGAYIKIESRSGEPGRPSQPDLRLITYDPLAKLYRLWSFGPGIHRYQELAGNFEGSKLVLTNEEEVKQPLRSIAGIGLQLEAEPAADGYFRVHSALPGTPADKAGLNRGDEITAIDGRSVVGMTGEQGRNLIRGAAGTPIHLTLRRGGQVREISLTREVFGVGRELLRLTLEPKSPTTFSELREVRRNGRFQTLGEILFRPAP